MKKYIFEIVLVTFMFFFCYLPVFGCLLATLKINDLDSWLSFVFVFVGMTLVFILFVVLIQPSTYIYVIKPFFKTIGNIIDKLTN